METRHVQDWKTSVDRVIVSKAEELQTYGYDEASPKMVWECLLAKVWKDQRELRLYQVVEDILHLDGHVFMSYLSNQNYQDNDDLMASILGVTHSQDTIN
ncbi:Post-transcriptional regulator [Pelagirhabdus alkalitolerans]|uniref:Post-transcriptional regulator n=1 Tax=Pelagirhabdus alkalitolerans TaxID=1612202 RepID=A0A1G6HR07_9BACI|nr:post-transcriptional regulator [Pelagirhabdus alkalitolerans]SDB96588.1 Post-transcriptional regulator [Pelagirhabdus alkalitolerans]